MKARYRRALELLAAMGVSVGATYLSVTWPWLVLLFVGSVLLVPAAWRGEQEYR